MLDKQEADGVGHDVVKGRWNRKAVSYVARRVVVQFARTDEESAMDKVLDQVLSASDGRALRAPSKTGRMVLLIPEGETVTTLAKRLNRMDGVDYAEPDFVDKHAIVPNDTRYPMQWAPPIVNAEPAWNLETGNGKVLIGIIDSGISMAGANLDHDDLSTPGRFTC